MFHRSKLSQPAKVTELLNKIQSILDAGKSNSFNVESPEGLFSGVSMTNVDLTSDPDKITFSFDGTDYELLISDLVIVQRIRSRKYKFKAKAVSVVV